MPRFVRFASEQDAAVSQPFTGLQRLYRSWLDMLLPERSFVASLMACQLVRAKSPLWSCQMLLLLSAYENDFQTVRLGVSGNDQALGLLESILLFFHVAGGCGGDRLRFQSHHRSELDPSENSATPFAVFSCGVVHGLAGVFHLAELTGTDAQRADSPDDRMVWWGNGGADSSGGSGNCRDDGQIRQDAIEKEHRRRRYDHPHVGLGVFTLAFVLAIYWRKRPEFHRRLIL